MATKSVLKTIMIKDSRSVRSLVNALDHAAGKHSREVKVTRSCKEMGREEIKRLFGANNDRI